MLTFQDFEQTDDKPKFIVKLIEEHMTSTMFCIAQDADLYDHQRNKTINEFLRVIYDITGNSLENYVAANNKIASNFFRRLNVQRCTYSLGNGISFTDHLEITKDEEGYDVEVDRTKERLGEKFDTDLKKTAYYALIHGLSFGYWNSERLYCFPLTTFAPLWDENDGALKAGVRFWQLDPTKPMVAVLYELDGFTKYRMEDGELTEVKPKRGYKTLTRSTEAEGVEVVGYDNYSSLPIIPMWGSDMKQSTLIGLQQAIDSFDLIQSGYANDLSDCSQIFWLLENYGGMTDDDLRRFRDKLNLLHIAEVNTQDGGKVTPYTQEIPYNARIAYLAHIKAGIYESFGGLDVHQVSASSTNDHLEAAYQPLDENADDFEFQLIEFIQQLLALEGIVDTPIFKRNKISNQSEQTDMIMKAAEYLDATTILEKLPFLTVDEISKVKGRRDREDQERMTGGLEGNLNNMLGGVGGQNTLPVAPEGLG